MKSIWILAIVTLLFQVDTFAQKKKAADPFLINSKPEVVCMGSELDGSVLVRSYGVGKNKKDAIKQLEKNAIFAVLFDGIRAGREDCSPRPLVTEVNARERYRKYFNKLFRDGGDYKKYIKHNDTPKKSKSQYQSSSKETFYTMPITVNIPKLQKHLDKDYVTLKDEKKRTIKKNEKVKKKNQ